MAINNDRHKSSDNLRQLAVEKLSTMTPPKALSAQKTEDLLHELRTHQIELEMQNEELKLSHRELELLSEKYFKLYDIAPVGYCTLNETGLVIESNLKVCDLLGVSRTYLKQQLFSSFVYKDDQDIYYLAIRHLSKTGYSHNCELRLIRRNGTTLWALLDISTTQDADDMILYLVMVSEITERKQAEIEKEERERLTNILEGTNAGNWEWNVQTGQTVFNERWAQIIGYTLKEISPVSIKTWERFIHPEDLKKSNEQLEKVFNRKSEYYDIECRMKHKDGSWVWIQDRGKIISWTSHGEPLLMAGTHTDISVQKKLVEELLNNKNKLDLVLNSVHVGIWELDVAENKRSFDNQSCILLGIDPVSFEGTEEEFYAVVHPDDRNKIKAALSETINRGILYEPDYRIVSHDGSIHYITSRAELRLAEDGSPQTISGILWDITERKITENAILHLSYHDMLTGLYNRRFFEEELKRLDTDRQLPLSIILGDLNSLKLTNDTFGHMEGDKLIMETAKLLKKVCRSDDILARWGGDEFVILLPKTPIAAAEEIVQRIKKECSELFVQKMPIGLAIGIASKSESRQNMEDIIFEAESNMYKNKLAGKQSSAGSVIAALEQALYEKSNETMEHTQRIKELSLKFGKKLKLHLHQLDELALLASLHDIGKVAVPETILLKEGALSENECEVMRRHPTTGFNIAQSSPQIAHIAKYILSCHENWDGSGYPEGLAKEEIPLLSRIVAITDSYDVMTGNRSYKCAISKEDAVKELKKYAGIQFDPVLVEKFIEVLAE